MNETRLHTGSSGELTGGIHSWRHNERRGEVKLNTRHRDQQL